MQKRYRTLIAAAALTALVAATGLIGAACGGDDTTTEESTAATFKIGYSADLTGGFASYDVPIRDGAQTAIDEINEAGGINGMKLEMIVKDNKNDKVLAVQTTQELIDEGIQYLIGTTSDHVVACNRLAQESQIPSSTGDGTAPNLVGDIGEYAFQYIMSDNIQGAALAEYAYNTMGYRTAFTLRCADIPYTANLPVYFQQAFEKLGGKVIGTAEYKYEAGDFAAQVTKIQNAKPAPDVIFTPMFLPDTPVFLKQLRAAGVQTPVVSTDGNDTPDLLSAGAKALDGLKFTTFAYPSEGTSLAEFYEAYKARYNKEPDTVIYANGYDDIYILKAALEESGGQGGAALRDALANLSGVDLATTDDYAMDPTTRRAKRSVALIEMKGAEFSFVEDLPYPQFVPEPL